MNTLQPPLQCVHPALHRRPGEGSPTGATDTGQRSKVGRLRTANLQAKETVDVHTQNMAVLHLSPRVLDGMAAQPNLLWWACEGREGVRPLRAHTVDGSQYSLSYTSSIQSCVCVCVCVRVRVRVRCALCVCVVRVRCACALCVCVCVCGCLGGGVGVTTSLS